jgi:hypothetical protein
MRRWRVRVKSAQKWKRYVNLIVSGGDGAGRELGGSSGARARIRGMWYSIVPYRMCMMRYGFEEVMIGVVFTGIVAVLYTDISKFMSVLA